MDSACLPPGLDCFNKYVKPNQDNCSAVLPCRGIYADVVKDDAEDLLMDEHVLARYREYKAGFIYNKGELLFDKLIENNHSFFTQSLSRNQASTWSEYALILFQLIK